MNKRKKHTRKKKWAGKKKRKKKSDFRQGWLSVHGNKVAYASSLWIQQPRHSKLHYRYTDEVNTFFFFFFHAFHFYLVFFLHHCINYNNIKLIARRDYEIFIFFIITYNINSTKITNIKNKKQFEFNKYLQNSTLLIIILKYLH